MFSVDVCLHDLLDMSINLVVNALNLTYILSRKLCYYDNSIWMSRGCTDIISQCITNLRKCYVYDTSVARGASVSFLCNLNFFRFLCDRS